MSTDSMSGYFRGFFEKNQELINERSNDAVIAQWMKDHPGDESFPQNARTALQNVKTLLRKKVPGKKRGRPRKDAAANGVAPVAVAVKTVKAPSKLLQTLEDRLDDCLMLLRGDTSDALTKVAGHLKSARRAVIIMGGGE